MARTFLILDVDYLAYRAFFTTGKLTYKSQPTGSVFGVLRELIQLEERFGIHDMVFCFDRGYNLRKEKYPWYKLRQPDPSVTEEALAGLRAQRRLMRKEFFPDLGYKNIFHQNGYEADDVIASVVRNLGLDEQAIIVSGDRDLYQLLWKNVMIYRPTDQSILDYDGFRKAFSGITAGDWPRVKAIAGCVSDTIPGVHLVGDATAAKFLTGQMNHKTETYKKISAWIQREQFTQNLWLTTLPLPGTRDFKAVAQPDRDDGAWEKLMDKLGIKSLDNHLDRGWRYQQIR